MVARLLIIAITAILASIHGQTCFFEWGGVFIHTVPLPQQGILDDYCKIVYRTSYRLYTSSTLTILSTITAGPSTFTITTTTVETEETGYLPATADKAEAGISALAYVVGNCVLNSAQGGVLPSAVWIGPRNARQTIVSPNGLTYTLCPAMSVNRAFPTAGYTPTLVYLDCFENELPFACAYTATSLTSTTVTVVSIIYTSTTTVGLSTTFVDTVTSTNLYSTVPLFTSSTTRSSLFTVTTETTTLSVSTSTVNVTVTSRSTVRVTSTFTYLPTSNEIITRTGTRTTTMPSTYTSYTTTITNESTDTFCSAREPECLRYQK